MFVGEEKNRRGRQYFPRNNVPASNHSQLRDLVGVVDKRIVSHR